jgi:hypothetical protein
VLVVVSLPFVGTVYHRNDQPAISYNKTVITRFDKCIEITNGHENRNKMINIKIRNNIRRNKNSVNDFHDSSKLLSINKIDLLTVSASIK